jgi:hypothetical protein
MIKTVTKLFLKVICSHHIRFRFVCVCVCVWCFSFVQTILWAFGHISKSSHTYFVFGLAYQGEDIVFKFIIEYSSLRDFGPS